MRKTVINYVKAALRRTWGRSKQRQTALKNAKISYGQYRCAKCCGVFRRKDIQVDHIKPIGHFVSFDTYIERLFVDTKGLQILCKGCHIYKTASDRKSFKK
jgi:5-methylcytosine-specific restriction endonuclease McrA